uniref:Uncharacterized protein n=1 Tax=Cucumis melo TaxID=3656 RepID=A0A9I9EMB5_CUCME
MARRPIASPEIKAKGDFMAMGGSFEKNRMKMNASMADQNAQNALTHLKVMLILELLVTSIIDPAAMENTVLEENIAAMFNINEALKVVLSLLLQIPALQNLFSFKRL